MLDSFYGVEMEDDVPFVAEGTTFNIHGGRDMFAKRSSAKVISKDRPPIAKKPSLERIARTRSIHQQRKVDADKMERYIVFPTTITTDINCRLLIFLQKNTQ